jgi:hypothetical protein
VFGRNAPAWAEMNEAWWGSYGPRECLCTKRHYRMFASCAQWKQIPVILKMKRAFMELVFSNKHRAPENGYCSSCER